jgi:hypothetical protein
MFKFLFLLSFNVKADVMKIKVQIIRNINYIDTRWETLKYKFKDRRKRV